ncbi:ribosomal protein L17, putative [Babesia bigemina]|uniref:Cytochrome c oxidase polypeptide II n=1 Tax=Babesia bigemina TaxID=5866 RepID=A0A061D118_BABBI|nr:ribosomal protein L17, putative [Babesia bigemina]CDR94516.1 ribosomal protein L17, putative [Babesia bigemina]|eukprot:XP_012766702.1 ribosomal protein L17, putative [Babesia bigemina]
MGFSATARLVAHGQRGRVFRKFRGQPPKRFDWLKNHLDRLLRLGRIELTLPRAKELQQYAEEVVFHAKKDTPESDLIVESMLRSPEARQKLYERYVPLYADRPFFFTRVINQWRLRFSDAAPMAYLEFVDRPGELRPAKPVGGRKLLQVHALMQASRRDYRKYYAFAKSHGMLDSEGNLLSDISHLIGDSESPWHERAETVSTINPQWREHPVMRQRLERIQSVDLRSDRAEETFESTYEEPAERRVPTSNPDLSSAVRRPRFNPPKVAHGEAPAAERPRLSVEERYPLPEKYAENPDLIPKYYAFQSNLVTDEDLQPGMLRQLEVDKRLTLPTRTHIRFLITATDVIHTWSVPSLGIKADAVPGRLHRVNTFIMREGVFYGQCSEMCGTLHGFMPIVVEAVAPETYAAHARKYYRED